MASTRVRALFKAQRRGHIHVQGDKGAVGVLGLRCMGQMPTFVNGCVTSPISPPFRSLALCSQMRPFPLSTGPVQHKAKWSFRPQLSVCPEFHGMWLQRPRKGSSETIRARGAMGRMLAVLGRYWACRVVLVAPLPRSTRPVA